MSLFRRLDLIDPYYNYSTTTRTTISALSLPRYYLDELLSLDLDLSPDLLTLNEFDSLTDLIQIDRAAAVSTHRRVNRRVNSDLYLQCLSDRVSALEVGYDRVVRGGGGDRKYTWEAEIKGGDKNDCYYRGDRKYKLTAEIKGAEEQPNRKCGASKGGVEKNYKLTAEFKDGSEESPVTRTYTFKASTGKGGNSGWEKKEEKKKDKKKEKGCKGVGPTARVVEIEEPLDHGSVVLRQAFAKRAGALERCMGKRKELSPQDAALAIQMTFKAYLIRRSQALRALRELAVAKSKLKELRMLFNNFAYRRRITRDAEERQKFAERIIVLLLTVDGIEGADLMVRSAKRSMVDELEAMLDVVDPQPGGKARLLKRRTFDMPDGIIQKELAAGVAEVVQMLDQENGTFEACL